MAVRFDIMAEVIDIRRDSPKPDDVFLVDTNIWYWLTYTRASMVRQPPMPYQINEYPNYISAIMAANSTLCNCGLSLAELAHLIERTEREIFIRSYRQIKTKEYRHNNQRERARVVSEINTAWTQIKRMSRIIDVTIGKDSINSAMNRLDTQPLDGYDLFFIETMSSSGISQIITDDGDYSCVPDIQVFTANNNVIEAARQQGKLVTR